MNFEKRKDNFNSYFDKEVLDYFSDDSKLSKSCLYSLLAGGKRIRPILTNCFSHLSGGQEELSFICGTSIEMIHTYSLIHDDLPALDNDDYRRGKLTNHKVFGESMAILAGDTLLNEAPLYILKKMNTLKVDSKVINLILLELLEASGKDGMIKGQVLDILNEDSKNHSPFKEEQIKTILQIHNNKTGKLFALSCVLGVLSHASYSEIDFKFIESARAFGIKLGLLFQIRDDILDTTKDFNELGKTPGKDFEAGKLTYISILGLDGALKMANTIHLECSSLIKEMKKYRGEESQSLIELLMMLKDNVY